MRAGFALAPLDVDGPKAAIGEHFGDDRASRDTFKVDHLTWTFNCSEVNQDGDVVGPAIGRSQIGATIGIEVSHCKRERPSPRPEVLGSLEGTIPAAQQNGDGIGQEIGRGQIGAAIGIEVAHRDGAREFSYPNLSCELEGAISIAQQDEDGVEREIGRGEILAAIGIEVTHRHGAKAYPRDILSGLEGAISIAQQNGDSIGIAVLGHFV